MLNPECPGCAQARNDLSFVHDELARQKRHVEAIGAALEEKARLLDIAQKDLSELNDEIVRLRELGCRQAEERGQLITLKNERIVGLELQKSALVEMLKEILTECTWELAHATTAKAKALLAEHGEYAAPVALNRDGPCTCGHNKIVHSPSIASGNGVGCTWWGCGCGGYKAKEESEKRLDACTCPHHEKAPHLTSCRCCSGKVNDS